MNKPTVLCELDYVAFWNNGTLTFNNGVGYVGEEKETETHRLYVAMKQFYKNSKEGEG